MNKLDANDQKMTFCHDICSTKQTDMDRIVENNDIIYMREALREAQAAARDGEIPIGAVIVSNGVIIAKAHNLTEQLQDTTAHAEMLAITSATGFLGSKYLTRCTLYVTVEPCPMCAAALCWSQIARVVYGAADPKRGYSRFSPSLLHPKTEISAGVLQDECSAIITDFFKKIR